jgi:hypothetical protein
MLKMKIFRLGTTNGDKRLGMIIIFHIYIYIYISQRVVDQVVRLTILTFCYADYKIDLGRPI